jgi:hypothetical protein
VLSAPEISVDATMQVIVRSHALIARPRPTLLVSKMRATGNGR